MELKTACSYATVSAWVCSELAAERSGLPHTGESGSLLNRRQQYIFELKHDGLRALAYGQ